LKPSQRPLFLISEVEFAVDGSLRIPESVRLRLAEPGRIQYGHVKAVDDSGSDVRIEVDHEIVPARVAVSCLVRPLVGDRVLFAQQGAEIFVLSVLERSYPNHATLALPGHGNLVVEGETVTVSARQKLTLRAGETELRTNLLSLIAERTTWIGRFVTAALERWHMSARTHEVSAEQHTTKASERVAVIDRLDAVHAEAQTVTIQGVATETALSKVVSVREDVRIDGKRISIS
jgi:hypothetical protein